MAIANGYKKFNRYAKQSDGTYIKMSQWTSSNTVHFDDGSTVQANLGAIKGITSDLACEDTNVAASMPAVSAKLTELNNGMFKSIFKQKSDTDNIILDKGGYLIFANAFSDNSSDSISGNIHDGNRIISKSTSNGVEGFGFSCGISLSDYVYISENTTFVFDVYCSGSIKYKNITAIKILK